MAEIELSVLAWQCLDRRIPDAATPEREVAAWERERNVATRYANTADRSDKTFIRLTPFC